MKTDVNEEFIELMWLLREKDITPTVAEIIKHGTIRQPEKVLTLLESDGFITLDGPKILFTPAGEERARQLIRSHRIAERLIYDVLGGEFESGACEFEHITNIGLVEAICTMLGHPRECPHGFPIPGGECCSSSADTVRRSVIPLTDMDPGQSGIVAYVYSKNDQQLHIIEGLQIKPGAVIKLHQKHPTFVIEVEDAHIALDNDIAGNIQVWRSTRKFVPVEHKHVDGQGRRSRRRRS
ncbi:MAG: metal-dependent transcriptional regulator [Spirochaetales bacterium]|nr:MAG: metal-dependent transcriptional regulator [Spirochaetales bacterium]